MGLTAAGSGAVTAVTELLMAIGIGVGSIFAAVGLVGALVGLELLDAVEMESVATRTALLATATAFGATFGTIVLFVLQRTL